MKTERGAHSIVRKTVTWFVIGMAVSIAIALLSGCVSVSRYNADIATVQAQAALDQTKLLNWCSKHTSDMIDKAYADCEKNHPSQVEPAPSASPTVPFDETDQELEP